jgi:hypothetical protein
MDFAFRSDLGGDLEILKLDVLLFLLSVGNVSAVGGGSCGTECVGEVAVFSVWLTGL